MGGTSVTGYVVWGPESLVMTRKLGLQFNLKKKKKTTTGHVPICGPLQKQWTGTFNSALKALWEKHFFFFFILRTFSPVSLKGLIIYHPNKLCRGEKKTEN